MIYVFLFTSAIVFVELFIALDVRQQAQLIVSRAREATRVILSSDLDDDQKETFMRRSSVEMFAATFKFLMKFLVIILVIYAMFFLITFTFPATREPILESFVSPIVMLGLTLAAFAYVWLRNVIFK